MQQRCVVDPLDCDASTAIDAQNAVAEVADGGDAAAAAADYYDANDYCAVLAQLFHDFCKINIAMKFN